MIKAAIVDHHLNNYHAGKFLDLLRGPLACEGVEITTAWESHPTGDDWCAKNGVPRATSIDDAVGDSDAVLLLAPDNIEDHLALANIVLPFGKPTLIDKFLAPTVAEAESIVRLAQLHHAPIVSASSLRYAVELEAKMPEISERQVNEVFVRGMGMWNGYGIHSLSLAIRIMGHKVKRVIDTGTPTARTVTLDFGEERRAVLDVRASSNEWNESGWMFAAKVGERYVSSAVKDYDGFYANLIRRTCRFFKTKDPGIEPEELLAIVAILEAANVSLNTNGEWISL